MNNFDFRKNFIILLALGGVLIMMYLTYLHYAQSESFCNLSETVSCDVVISSIYSEVFGIPISIGGLLFFSFILYLILKVDSKTVYQSIFFSTLFFLIPSLYFTMTEIFFLQTYCILCETSKVIMLVILILAYPRAKSFVNVSAVAPLLIAGVVMSVVIYFSQTTNIARVDYTNLVTCLNEKGVVYYKSFRCSNCRRQEMILGPAYNKLNAIECHPEGKNPQVELCLAKKIVKTPTFIIEDINKNEIKRLEGRQLAKALADFAGCPVEENK